MAAVVRGPYPRNTSAHPSYTPLRNRKLHYIRCRGSAYLPTKQLNATPYVTKQQQPTRFNERLSVELDPERRIDGSRTSVQVQSRSEEHISTYTLVFPLMFVLQSFTSLSEAHSHSREVSGYIISTNVSIIEKAETVVRAALI
uniref:Uncharacterized protein n=1 Tax=Timema tahoe TaxID=61484 RepID=A0A7R9FN17_9NEOP|nr:unnamed protein product [Timema tahoe]